MRRLGIPALALCASAVAFAQVPGLLGYQGRLLKADGSPANGVVTMSFSLFDAETGGAALGCEVQQVALTDGFYSVLLGRGTASCPGGLPGLTPTLFQGDDRFLEVSVGGAPLTPRQRVASVAYALRAGTATHLAGGTVSATSISVGGNTVIDSSGRLTGPAALTTGAGLTGQGTSASPLAVGFAGAGSATTASRSDHSHPPGDAATLGGVAPSGFVHNGTSPQAASFNVTGQGAVGGNLLVSGNLGVGTASPTERLTVNGNIHATGSITCGSGSCGGSGGGGVPAGSLLAFAGAAAPSGWLLADGSAVSRTTYAALFAAIGTTFGAGDGSTTFNLPDLRQRFPLGKAASGVGSTLGATGGSIDHTHAGAAHAHTFSDTVSASTSSAGSHNHSVAPPSVNTGSAGAHAHTVTTDWCGATGWCFRDSDAQGGTPTHGNQAITTNTSSTGSHAHSVSFSAFNSGTGGAHSHSLADYTASGTTSSGGGGNTGAANPPFLVLSFIIKH